MCRCASHQTTRARRLKQDLSSAAMSTVQFTSSAYVQLRTLNNGHSDTVNSLCFSSDGVHLASGGDDQSVIIWNALKGQLLYRILFDNAVDCVLWHPKYAETLIVGLASGFLLQMHGFSLVSAIARFADASPLTFRSITITSRTYISVLGAQFTASTMIPRRHVWQSGWEKRFISPERSSEVGRTIPSPTAIC